MSNNLRQIAKDLRSFVKRCKDVHYSDSLLITFLVTGLLTTFAPSIIRADVAEDQQEVSAQAYDTITDLRQSFLRAKKENQKALRGANAELAQLLKEGDQVVKSPWASFQFGTGYTNNDWGTSYKGRGGKKLEYYSRTNDLTKYVFDASKHQYGATNLNVKRNKEPNTLAITPANIHEPYKPYDVTKLDAIALPTAPTFDPNMPAPNGVTTYDFTYDGRTVSRQPETEVARSTSINDSVRFNNLNANYATYTTNANDALTTNTTTGNANSASLANGGTFDIGATNKRLYDTAWWWSSYQGWEFTNVSDIEGGDFKIYDHNTGNSVSHVTGTFDTDSTYSTVKVNGSGNYGGRDDASYAVPSISYSGNSIGEMESNARLHARLIYATNHPEVHWNTISALTDSELGLTFGNTHSGEYAATVAGTGEISWRDSGTGTVTYTPSSWTGTAYNHKADSSIKVSAGNVNLKGNKFTIIDGNGRTRAGLHVAGGTVNMTGGNTFNVDGTNSKKNDGALVASGTLNTSGTNAFNISGSENNGLGITGGTVTMKGTTNFDVGGTQNNNGIFLNGGDLDAEGVKMTLSSGKEQIGLNNTNGSSAKLKNGSFSITDGVTESNAVYANKDTTTESIAYTIRTETGKNNGVYLNGSAKLNDKTSTYTVEGSENNGIYSASTGLASIVAPTFDVSGKKNNGISVNGTGGATIDSTSLRAKTDPNFKITGTNNNGIVLRAAGPLKVEKMRFDISGTSADPSVPDPGAQNNGILLKAAGQADVKDSAFTVTGRDNSAIWGESGAAINTTRNTFELGGTETNGVYLNAASTALTDVDSDFNITGTKSNGIYAKVGSADLQGTRMTVNGTNNNGLIVFQTATPVKVQYGTRRAGFTVNNNNNGIFVTGSATVASISNTDFVVSDSGIGILAGDSNGVGTVTKIENSTFDVKGTNANTGSDKTGTGIYMYQGVVTAENNVTMTGDSNDIFVTIRNRDHNNTIDLIGANGGNRVLLKATGANNVGINIQNGDSTATAGKTVTVKSTGDKGWNTDFVGDNNTGIKNNYFADTLVVKNTVGTNLPTSLTDSGVMTITGENATGFVNLGYVNAGTLQLDYLNLSGVHSVGAAFLNNNYTKGRTAPLVDPSTVNTGIFNGSNAVKLQGVIGGTEGGTIDSLNSVGVYANTGQSTLLSKSSVGYSSGGGAALTDLEVVLQLGFQKNARKSTLIWAENGTKVKVLANSYAGNVAGNTSDGIIYSGGTPKFGYNETEDIVVSTGSTIGYATGYLDTNEHGYIPSAGPRYQASEIEFVDGVDMLAKEGTALHVDKGGKITAKTVRAGGYESILAYATGKHPIGGTSSAIEINGQIVAADNNLLGKNYNVTGKVVQKDLPKTYNNVGAYASNGGKVTIKTATVSDTTLEVSGGSLAPTGDPTKSLIFGMAAYATGNGSEVKFDNAKTTVVTGIYGGLYATDKGQIEFAGDIINQNNAGLTQSTKTAGSATGIANDQTRKARGNDATDHNGNVVANDHKNVTPFYVKRTKEGSVTDDDSGIVFNAATGIDMYDGILYTGNQYNVNSYTAGDTYNTIRDYYKDAARPTGTELDKWKMAKYRGMSHVTAAIMSDNYAVELGVINQAAGLKWNELGNTNPKASASADNYLGSIGDKYAGGMKLTNESNGTTSGGTQVGNRFHSTLINSDITIDKKTSATVTVNLENEDLTDNGNIDDSKKVDPFNDIKMESTLVTIGKDATVKGDVANRYRAGQGLNMANSLNRWETPDNVRSRWIKTGNDKSGYINKGKIDVFGGTKTNGITGVNVAFGTVQNLNDGGTDSSGEIQIDHGHAIHATDGSSIKNTGKITVTGKLTQLSHLRGLTESAEGTPSGNNYGIVGISDTDAIAYNVNDDWTQKINTLNIEHSGEHAITKVEGQLAVGIYGENRNNAKASDIKIKYDTSARSQAGIDVSNANVTSSEARGVGIALVNGSSTTYANGALDAGGEITLKGFGGNSGNAAATSNDILTGKNGVGIYAESAEINVDSNNFVVKTEDNGVGLWAMDDTVIARGTKDKEFVYNYFGKNDKNGFAMAFGGRNTNATTAANYMDVMFANTDDTQYVNLENENNAARTGTNKGIVGILVNTNNASDTVTNYGKIEETESSVTNLKAYGALVNKGTFINHGDIKLNASLMNDKNSTITTADMKKVNVGILANDHSERARYNSYIENYANITIGQDADSKNNVGSWAIYGYNIKTGAKLDGTEVVYKINRNSNGIYSGDGNVDIQKGTVLKVGNDTVLGHVRPTQVVNGKTIPSRQPDITGTGYADPDDLLSGLDNPRERDSAVGVYINNNRGLSDEARTVNVAADMDIDRFSHGIVLAEKTGGALTTVNMGTSAATAPKIRLAYSTASNPGGQVHSTKPYEPEIFSEEVNEQGNAVYYYSADDQSRAKSYANVTMDGDYNTAYFTKGSVTNYGSIDLRSQYDLDLRNNDPNHVEVGYGNVGIISENTSVASVNEGEIITGLSDTQNMMYSVGMGAGRNFYRTNENKERVYERTEGQGYIINNGTITVQEENGIGMLATGRGSKAINNGTIRLVGKNGIGMYLDREAIGENHGTIIGDAENLKGVVAINGGYIKNYGTIKVEGTGSYGIVTDSSKFTLDANGNPIAYHTDTDSVEYKNGTTAGQANGHGGTDLYGGTETSIEEGTSGNPKTTGVGTTIKRPNIVPLTSVTIDGVEQPIFNFNNDADVVGKQAENILVTSTVQTVAAGATELQMPIWLRAKDEYGNPAWPRYNSPQMSEVTRVGMYVDTSGVRYTNPIDGIEKLTKLGKVDLYFGTEITEYTNSKAIRIAHRIEEDAQGNKRVIENNILRPFNDALRKLPGGATVNPLSASLTWQVSANIDDNNQITELVMSKVPYHSFAFDGDKRLINFTNNLDNIYEIARPGSEEKMIFNKLNSLGNGEGHILAQAFDQMRGHIYGGIQQRTNATSNLLTDELAQLRSENNASKDSNKIKAFGRREEYKTDTAGLPDWHSNAGGFVYLHEDETVKLGDRSGWYAGVVNNYFTFKDLARSYENQAMLKTGIFKQTPLDEDGTFTFTIGGDAFFGKTNTKRRFWVVDKEFRAKSDYYTYGADINAKLEKEFRLTEGFSIVPNVGLDLQYGRFSTVNEDGDMALKIKSDDYYSVKPRAGVDFRYSQPVFKKSNFVASVGLAYETELGRLNDVDNEAKIKGAWTDYYSIKGDKEDRKGNFKSDLKLGLDNGRLGFTVNTGYDTKGHNFRAGLGLRALF